MDAASVDVRDKSDISRAAITFRDSVERLCDVRIIVSHNIATRRPMVDENGAVLAATIFGFVEREERWWNNGQLALQSPLARACRYESQPFWADERGFRTLYPNQCLDAIDLTQFERRAFVAAAIVVPVHLPFGQIAMAAFAPRKNTSMDLGEVFHERAEALMLLTQRFVTSYVQATRRRVSLPLNCSLTRRETECLNWASLGKTDREICEIIGRSHTTVRFHLRNAAEKLNAVNRSQSIFKAGQLGYLSRTQ
ncbi:LuxR C-terminal-related transcriptional regulator [Sphingoaurantiacus capsulatus]|uniref:LuxR C-terminal-related transcriptional regulator n=1 Tax=Sphingoaurantiacus capsulatus TaxID=1771310 RepID=A0ABV7XB65_9SPHN